MNGGGLIDVLLLEVAGQRVGLPAAAVHEVLPCARFETLAKAPPFVEGMLNVRGRALPVLSLRERLGHPRREPALDEHLVRVEAGPRELLLRVDRALDLVGVDPARLEGLDDRHRPFAGVVATPDGVLLVQDPERFLEPRESGALAAFERSRAADRAEPTEG
ncbi:MAG TPA: chemotaxis protein CheW [Sandaracinaceae bacterium LLY-WYZ-13_1]|nr:chemotaxis protein CheW [Sandaracinaceae bacterium LLY-WYZ-13_1]